MLDIVLESTRALVLLALVIFLWRRGGGRIQHNRRGWNLIVSGFLLLLFGSLLDITDNFEILNRFVIIGDTVTEAFLEKFVGFLGGFLVLALGLVIWIPSLQQIQKELETRVGERTDELRESQIRLFDAIDAVPDGFVFYDHDDRLVMCNEKYRKIYPESADLLVTGAQFETIIRKGVARGQYADAVGCEEKWICERMEVHRNPKGPIEQRLPNGRWLRIEERKTEDGGIVGFRIDITELKRRELELERLASTDQLTGALNRRRFLELGEQEFRRADRYGGSTTVLLIDIDFFKRINDSFGHAAGDEVLRRLVRAVTDELRVQDILCRFGGEEFAVLLPQTELAGAHVTAERLRQAIGELEVPYKRAQITITSSIGAAVREGLGEGLDESLARADKALYEAKHAGRDCVAVAPLQVAVAS